MAEFKPLLGAGFWCVLVTRQVELLNSVMFIGFFHLKLFNSTLFYSTLLYSVLHYSTLLLPYATEKCTREKVIVSSYG